MSTRLSSADAAWLHMDRPTNLMVINAVLLFHQPVDWQRLREVVQTRMVDRYPKFHQRVIESRLPLRPPKWEDDPDYALEHHLHHRALPAPGDAAALQEMVGDLMTVPLDRNRPLWHFYLADGFGDGAALICRAHHCIADGIALAGVMLSLTDRQPDAAVTAAAVPERRSGPAPLADLARLGRTVARGGATVVRQGVGIASSPSHAAKLAGAIGRDGATLVKLVLTPADAASAIKGDPGISRRVAWTEPLSLQVVKDIAHTHGATVNDVLLAAVTGALRHYLQDRGSAVPEIQAMVPFNLRPLDKPVPRELGNKFGLVFLPLPVGTSGSYRRLTEVHRRTQELKESRDGAVTYGVLSATGLAPEPVERRVIDLFTAKGTAVMTNVPGPREPVYMAGTAVHSALVWAPASGHIGMSVSIFSYCGEVTVGLMVDAALVPDPNQIVTQLEREVAALARLEHEPRRGRSTQRRQPTRG
jgi:diacylglycerol O-acyltransferase / wax synthase